MPLFSDISTSLGVNPRQPNSNVSSSVLCWLLIFLIQHLIRDIWFSHLGKGLKYQLCFIHAALSNSLNCPCNVILLPPLFLLLFRTKAFPTGTIHSGFWNASSPAGDGVCVNGRKPALVNFWFALDHHGLLFWGLLKESSNPWCHATSPGDPFL